MHRIHCCSSVGVAASMRPSASSEQKGAAAHFSHQLPCSAARAALARQRRPPSSNPRAQLTVLELAPSGVEWLRGAGDAVFTRAGVSLSLGSNAISATGFVQLHTWGGCCFEREGRGLARRFLWCCRRPRARRAALTSAAAASGTHTQHTRSAQPRAAKGAEAEAGLCWSAALHTERRVLRRAQACSPPTCAPR